MVAAPDSLDPSDERRVAVDLFNHVWRLLELDERSVDDEDALVHAAHASRWHWGRVGGPEQWAIGEWQCSRVYAELGRGPQSLFHAQRCLAICHEHSLESFVPASAHEALARAHAVMGDFDAARAERDIAYQLAGELDDDGDRGVIEADLATLPLPPS